MYVSIRHLVLLGDLRIKRSSSFKLATFFISLNRCNDNFFVMVSSLYRQMYGKELCRSKIGSLKSTFPGAILSGTEMLANIILNVLETLTSVMKGQAYNFDAMSFGYVVRLC